MHRPLLWQRFGQHWSLVDSAQLVKQWVKDLVEGYALRTGFFGALPERF